MAAPDSGEIIRSNRNHHGEAGERNFDHVLADSVCCRRPSIMLNVSLKAEAFRPAAVIACAIAAWEAARSRWIAASLFACMRAGSRTRADGEELVSISFSSFNRLSTPSSAASWCESGRGKTIITGSKVAGNFFIISASVFAAGMLRGSKEAGEMSKRRLRHGTMLRIAAAKNTAAVAPRTRPGDWRHWRTKARTGPVAAAAEGASPTKRKRKIGMSTAQSNTPNATRTPS